MNSLAAALVFVALALAAWWWLRVRERVQRNRALALAWWWLRPRGGFAVDPGATYTLTVAGRPLRFANSMSPGPVISASGTKLRLVPAPGALAGVPGATGDAFTIVRAAGDATGLTLGGRVDVNYVLQWGAPLPVYLEVRDDGVVLRGSGLVTVVFRSDGVPLVLPANTARRAYAGQTVVQNYDARNLALFLPTHVVGSGSEGWMLPANLEGSQPNQTSVLQLSPA